MDQFVQLVLFVHHLPKPHQLKPLQLKLHQQNHQYKPLVHHAHVVLYRERDVLPNAHNVQYAPLTLLLPMPQPLTLQQQMPQLPTHLQLTPQQLNHQYKPHARHAHVDQATEREGLAAQFATLAHQQLMLQHLLLMRLHQILTLQLPMLLNHQYKPHAHHAHVDQATEREDPAAQFATLAHQQPMLQHLLLMRLHQILMHQQPMLQHLALTPQLPMLHQLNHQSTCLEVTTPYVPLLALPSSLVPLWLLQLSL
jgi:hypothetical protein